MITTKGATILAKSYLGRIPVAEVNSDGDARMILEVLRSNVIILSDEQLVNLREELECSRQIASDTVTYSKTDAEEKTAWERLHMLQDLEQSL